MNYPSFLIYIPTYNRYERLCEQIDLILPSLSDYKTITLMISNNASTDDKYKELDKKYVHPNLIFINNKVNLGANPNIFNGFIQGLNYDYVWILSDDDTILPTAISQIMHILTKSQDLIYFKLNNPRENMSLYFFDDFLDNLNFGLGLISCAIIKTSKIRDTVKIGYEYIDSGFPHLAVMFSACIYNKFLSVYECPSNTILKTKIPDPPAETKLAYVHGIYGFAKLADFITNDKRRYEFLYKWMVSDFNLWSVVEYKDKFPERYRNLKGYVFMQSPLLFLYFLIGCTIMSTLMFIWNKLSVPNRKRLKAIMYPV